MFYIKLDDDMNLIITVREPIYRGDNLNQKIVYLIPTKIGDINVSLSRLYLNYIHTDGTPDVAELERLDTMYNEKYYQYTHPVTCKLTRSAGEVCTWLEVYSGPADHPVVSKSGECILDILESKSIDDCVDNSTLTVLYQVQNELDAHIQTADDDMDNLESRTDEMASNYGDVKRELEEEVIRAKAAEERVFKTLGDIPAGKTVAQMIDDVEKEPGKDGVDGTNGVDGKDGADGLTPFIGENGNWWIGTTDTGIQAKGVDGKDGTSPVKGEDYFTDTDKREMAEAAAELVDVPTNVSAFTNDAEYISNKPGSINERLSPSLYGWIEGYYCNVEHGRISAVSHYAVTDYLEVDPNWQNIITYVRADGDSSGICFYDSAKTFISGAAHGDTGNTMGLFKYAIPAGAAYFCVSTRLAVIDDSYIEVVKQADGVLARISKLEALFGKASAITYGYAVSNILCIGDSMTNGSYYAGEANGLDIANGAAIAQNYPYYLGRMLRCRTTKAAANGYSASDWFNQYISLYKYAEYDAFIIWMGTNYGCTAMPPDAEISAFSPDSSETAATANQALYLIKIIQTIQAENTSCHIVLCNVFSSKSDKAANNEVVAQIAEKYGCQLVDMSDLSYSNHPELHAGVNNPHFGKAGNIYIANRLAAAIDDYIASDPLSGDFGTTTVSMPTLTANEKEEIVAAVVASLPVYSGEVV